MPPRGGDPTEPHLVEAQLMLEGLRCSACAWLIEQVVLREAGVASFDLNYATRRAWVRWNPQAAKLSATSPAGWSDDPTIDPTNGYPTRA